MISTPIKITRGCVILHQWTGHKNVIVILFQEILILQLEVI